MDYPGQLLLILNKGFQYRRSTDDLSSGKWQAVMMVRHLHGFCSGWAITLTFTGVADLSEVMEHVSWTTSHTTLYLLYQLVKVFNPGGATPSVRINSRGTLTGCRSLRLSNQWAGIPSMADILIKKNLRLLGHVHRMDNNRLPKKLLYFQLCLAMRNQ